MLGGDRVAVGVLARLALLRLPRDHRGARITGRLARDACDQCAAVCAGDRLPTAPGGGIGRRDRAHAVAARDDAIGTLLEWQTASQVERVMGTGSPREVWRRMWPAVAIAGAVIGDGPARLLRLTSRVIHEQSASWMALNPALYLAVTVPIIALWLVSPSIANALSKPVVRRERHLTATER